MLKPNTRRDMMIGGGAAAASLVLVTCTAQQVADVEKQIAAFITEVQAKVKEACLATGTWVPTANTVVAIIQSILGTTNPASITAAIIAQVISEIVSVGCPAPPPAGTTGAAARGPQRAPKDVRGVSVEFY